MSSDINIGPIQEMLNNPIVEALDESEENKSDAEESEKDQEYCKKVVRAR